LVCFNTALEKDGRIKSDRKLVTKSYLRSWFLLDLIATIPYGDFFFPHTNHTLVSNENTRLKHGLKLLRLIRLIRLFRVSRLFQRIQNTVFIRSTVTALMKYLLIVMFVAHWCGCLFHVIASASTYEKNWIKEQHLTEEDGADNIDRYVAALYFAITTL
jgi:hyperpolarization activated cyclic nucleotide-gated potassium channel 2